MIPDATTSTYVGPSVGKMVAGDRVCSMCVHADRALLCSAAAAIKWYGASAPHPISAGVAGALGCV
jgi:hypothetical protein